MKGQVFPMKKETLKLLPLIFIALLLFVGGFLLLTGGVGVPRSRLEEDLRTSQNIPDDWTVTSSVSDSAAVFLYYPPAQNRYGWSIYINHPGLSFGYFFRGSLVAAGIHDNKEELPAAVKQIPIGDSGEIAYISLNLTGIVRAEIDNGAERKPSHWTKVNLLPFWCHQTPVLSHFTTKRAILQKSYHAKSEIHYAKNPARNHRAGFFIESASAK